MNAPPEIIETYWSGLDWTPEVLWALELPTERFPIARLEWHLDVPLWAYEDKPFQLTPRQVVRAPFRYDRHYRRARAASLMFPLEITRHNGRWVILDGVHRLLKAHEDGHEEVYVRKVPTRLVRMGAK